MESHSVQPCRDQLQEPSCALSVQGKSLKRTTDNREISVFFDEYFIIFSSPNLQIAGKPVDPDGDMAPALPPEGVSKPPIRRSERFTKQASQNRLTKFVILRIFH